MVINTPVKKWLLVLSVLVGAVVSTLLNESVCYGAGATVAQAIRESQKTGKPIFAVAGASYCPACVKLLKTLNTDASLQPLIAEFVPLKINAQSPDYARWKQFFPPERSAIPALFIVTPQGKPLFSRVGALPSENLQKVLLTSLEKAGRYPSSEEWNELAKTMKAAEQALKDDQLGHAIELLEPAVEGLTKLGALAKLSTPGREASAAVAKFADQQQEALEKALKDFVAKGDLDTALELVGRERLCEMFPDQRLQAKKRIKQEVRSSEQRKLLKQARELHQARSLAGQSDSKRKGEAALKRVMKRYPNTEVAERARLALGQDR